MGYKSPYGQVILIPENCSVYIHLVTADPSTAFIICSSKF